MSESELRGHKKDCSCRGCRLMRFAEAVEQLLNDSAGGEGMTSEEYDAVFTSKVKELHQEMVRG